jgi:hypothetical protein
MDWKKQYVEEKGYAKFNKFNVNEYTKFLEQKLTETNQALQLLQPDVIKSVCTTPIRVHSGTGRYDREGNEVQ